MPDTPLNQAKRDILTGDNPAMGNVVFQWGRPDEQVCDTLWTDNLPAFSVGGASIPARCTAAGGEIKEKMMDRNGFTARELFYSDLTFNVNAKIVSHLPKSHHLPIFIQYIATIFMYSFKK